jgi:hypothetical protein
LVSKPADGTGYVARHCPPPPLRIQETIPELNNTEGLVVARVQPEYAHPT